MQNSNNSKFYYVADVTTYMLNSILYCFADVHFNTCTGGVQHLCDDAQHIQWCAVYLTVQSVEHSIIINCLHSGISLDFTLPQPTPLLESQTI